LFGAKKKSILILPQRQDASGACGVQSFTSSAEAFHYVADILQGHRPVAYDGGIFSAHFPCKGKRPRLQKKTKQQQKNMKQQ